jgi:tRNA dimethylallyltransferase
MICLVGPTAVGKSSVALALAKRLNGEIVSCDAMQVYRECRIASDRPSDEMLKTVPHHLVGMIPVREEFNAARWRGLALEAVSDIQGRGRLPIVCGGSGMYFSALLDGLFEGGGADLEVRARLEAEADAVGSGVLYERLKTLDPVAASKMDSQNKQRIVRALEVIETTGMRLSDKQKERDGLWGKMNIRVVGLSRSREILYARSEARIDAMFKEGLVDEVRTLLAQHLSSTAARIIGLPEVGGYLANEYPLERAVYLMKRNTRHYVKRQMTWFLRDKRVEWLDMPDNETPEASSERIINLL